nr:hypothetical protein [Tanacetum cinerariifolium]
QLRQFLKEKSSEAKVKHDIDVIEKINIELEHKLAKLLKENETLKKNYKELFDSIKITRAKTTKHTTSLIETNDKFKAQLQEKGFAIAALKNELRKSTGNSVNTKFAKSSILGKPMSQPLRNQSVVRQPTAFKSERPRFLKPRNSEPSLMPSARLQSTTNGSKPMPRRNTQTSRNWPATKNGFVTTKTVPIAEHSRNSRNDSCLTKFLKEVNSRAKVPSYKTPKRNKPVEQIGVPNKQERHIPTGHMFSIQKTSVVQKNTMTPRSCLRWKPTGKIFKTVGLRWVPTGRILTSSTTKVDKEPLNGSNADITNQYECEQTLDVSAVTTHYLSKGKESACAKPHHMIAPGSSRWKPTGKIFKTVGLRWVPTGKIFTSSTTKVDSEPTNGLNEDITNQYECEHTLDVSADSNSELLIPTPWFDKSKNEKRAKRWREDFEWKRSLFEIDFTFGINAFDLDKGTDVMKDTWKKRMDANVPDEIDCAKGEQVPNHVVKKGNFEFLKKGIKHCKRWYWNDPELENKWTKQAPKLFPGKSVKVTTKVEKSGKKKQPALGLETLTEVALTEAKQLKLATQRSLIHHSLHASGSGAHEGTGVKPGVLDVPIYRSDEEEISWKSSDEEDDDDEANLDKDEDDNDQEDDDNTDHNDDSERTDSDNDGDDFVHPKFSTHDDEARQEEEVNKEEIFNLVVQTPSQLENTDDEDNDDDSHGMNIEGDELDDERVNEEDDGNELYRDMNINLEGQQQSSSMSPRFVSNVLNPSPDTGIDSIFNLNIESTPWVDVPVTTTAEPPLLISSSVLSLKRSSTYTGAMKRKEKQFMAFTFTMTDQRTMEELLRAPTEGYAKAIVVPLILAEQFKLKHSLINMMTTDQFFGLKKDNPHDHICWFNKITSTIKYRDVPNSDLVSKFINEFFPPSRTTSLRNKISNFQQRFDESFHEAWDRYKDLLRACPHHSFTEFHQLDTFYNTLNPADQDSLNAAAGGNLLERKIAKPTHAVNMQTSSMTTATTVMLKQFQATPPPAPVKVVEEIYVTCGGSGSLPSNTVANPKGKLKAITTRSGLVINGSIVPTPPKSINLEVDERVEETFTNPDLAEYTIKVSPPPVQKYKPPSQREFVVHKRDPLHPNIPYPSRILKQKQQEKDEVQIQKFWQMFKQLHINITLADALILMPKYQKMLKALLSNKEKLQELANTPFNENCSVVILKKLPKKLEDPGKFLILCGFSELKCKALADLANRAICTPAGIARDVFVPVGKFTFPTNFFIVDYEIDPRVPLILGRPFLRTARALINVHGEEMIFRDGDERLTLNMRHDTFSYSNQPQKESINLINVFNNSSEDFLEDLFPKQPSGNPTFLPHPELTSPKPEIFTDKHVLDYSSPLIFDEYDDDLFEDESNTENVYDDPFDPKGEKIKESKLLIDELDLPCDFLLPS